MMAVRLKMTLKVVTTIITVCKTVLISRLIFSQYFYTLYPKFGDIFCVLGLFWFWLGVYSMLSLCHTLINTINIQIYNMKRHISVFKVNLWVLKISFQYVFLNNFLYIYCSDHFQCLNRDGNAGKKLQVLDFWLCGRWLNAKY